MLDQNFLHGRLQGFLGDLLVAAGCRICGLIIRVIDGHSAIVIIVIFACVGHVGLLLLCCLLSHLLLSWCSWNLSCQLRRSFGPMQGFGPAGPFMGMFHYFKCFRCQRDLHSISSKFGVRNLKHQANCVCCDNHGFTHGSCPECAFWLVLDWTHLKNQKWDNRGRTTGAIWERRKRGHASLGTSWHHPAIGNIRRCHQALAWILGPWFLSWRHFWHVLLGPRDSISNIFFLITRWVISSLWILSPKPFAVFFIFCIVFTVGSSQGFYPGPFGLRPAGFYPKSWLKSLAPG